jgi:rhodanese-related sulfurtransferase
VVEVTKRVSPSEAKELIEKQGYVYIDVRSVPEFEAGHPTGAYNVPIMNMGPVGMTPNPEFVDVMRRAFPKDAKLVVGCKSGGRSARAAAALEQAGYAEVVDQRAGFEGAPDFTGHVAEPGWRPKGLPVSREAAPDHTYEGLKTARR